MRLGACPAFFPSVVCCCLWGDMCDRPKDETDHKKSGRRDERRTLTRWASLSRRVVLHEGECQVLARACMLHAGFLQHLCPSERYPPFHQRVLDQMGRSLRQVRLLPAERQRFPAFRVSSSKPDGPSDSPVQPDLSAVLPAIYQHRHVLVRLGHLGQHRQHYESTNRANRRPTHPSIAHRRTRRPSSAASRAESPGQSAGGACAGARCTAWRGRALRLIRAGAARGRGQCGASTFRSGVSASSLGDIFRP